MSAELGYFSVTWIMKFAGIRSMARVIDTRCQPVQVWPLTISDRVSDAPGGAAGSKGKGVETERHEKRVRRIGRGDELRLPRRVLVEGPGLGERRHRNRRRRPRPAAAVVHRGRRDRAPPRRRGSATPDSSRRARRRPGAAPRRRSRRTPSAAARRRPDSSTADKARWRARARNRRRSADCRRRGPARPATTDCSAPVPGRFGGTHPASGSNRRMASAGSAAEARTAAASCCEAAAKALARARRSPSV